MKVNQPGDPCNNPGRNIERLLDELEAGIDLTAGQKDQPESAPKDQDFPFVSTALQPTALRNDDSEPSPQDPSED